MTFYGRNRLVSFVSYFLGFIKAMEKRTISTQMWSRLINAKLDSHCRALCQRCEPLEFEGSRGRIQCVGYY